MTSNRKKKEPQQKWLDLEKQLETDLPHLAAFLSSNGEFRELRIVSRDDGTCLAMAKGWLEDGTPSIAFGTGYTPSLSLMGLDATLAAGHWKKDQYYGFQGKRD